MGLSSQLEYKLSGDHYHCELCLEVKIQINLGK